MIIRLYQTSDDNSVISKNLTNELTLENVVIKHNIDILNPSFFVTTNENLSNYNYCFIERYGRYYYLSVESENNNVWRLNGKVDVLKTYESSIRNLYGTITRNENLYNGYLNDGEFIATNYRQIVTKKFPNAMENDTFILMTVG